uniref:Uncharacterized protein n=1 Tax=Panagrolaimus davidi TaxID=227884 RepID=A0A914PDU8_9BILA
MKIFSCFFICVQFLFLDFASAAKFHENASNNSGILDGNVREKGTLSSDAMLLSDGNAKGTKYGERDLLLSGHGPINLTFTSRELEFEFCNCEGTSSVCYKSWEGFDNDNAAGSCSDSKSCEFKVRDGEDRIYFGRSGSVKTSCFQTSMKYPYAAAKDTEGNVYVMFHSCTPKMVDSIIELYVYIDPSCSIIVKNAKVHVPIVLSTTKVPPKHSAEHSKDPYEASFPWWGFLIIGLVLLIVVAVIGFIMYRLYKKRHTSKCVPQKADETKPRATVSKADVETPTKKHDDLEAAKVEPIQKSKKYKKKKQTKTEEPTKTEDIPAPTITQQESTEAQPAAAHYPQVKRLIPRSMKSAKTDSFDETLKKDKTAMVESLVVCAGNHCFKTDETDVLDEFKENYPNIQHEVMPSEIKLLCLPVSQMYTEMNILAFESEQKLSAAGCEFDKNGRILSVSKDARRLLKNKATDATTVYFAFGAEYHQYITAKIMDKASVPLLYAIALQPRFSEASRRKACATLRYVCATLRRYLVKVFGYFKAADRARMPFPINIVENAYCRDPKYFYDPAGIKTDSGSDQKRSQWVMKKEKRNHQKNINNKLGCISFLVLLVISFVE